jgi:predicted kinase
MDEIRQRIMPLSNNTIEDRNFAYRLMHDSAKIAIAAGRSVVIDATYARRTQRRAIMELLQQFLLDAFIIELRVDPDEAEKRFIARSEGHAAIDLTVERVRRLARSFPVGNVGLSIDTTEAAPETIASQVLAYLSESVALREVAQWAETGDA